MKFSMVHSWAMVYISTKERDHAWYVEVGGACRTAAAPADSSDGSLPGVLAISESRLVGRWANLYLDKAHETRDTGDGEEKLGVI